MKLFDRHPHYLHVIGWVILAGRPFLTLPDFVKYGVQGQQPGDIKLAADAFCGVRNSFIVSPAKVSSFQKTNLFIGKQEIPVGSGYAEEFERRYGTDV